MSYCKYKIHYERFFFIRTKMRYFNKLLNKNNYKYIGYNINKQNRTK
jgi:hypothetical protein